MALRGRPAEGEEQGQVPPRAPRSGPRGSDAVKEDYMKTQGDLETTYRLCENRLRDKVQGGNVPPRVLLGVLNVLSNGDAPFSPRGDLDTRVAAGDTSGHRETGAAQPDVQPSANTCQRCGGSVGPRVPAIPRVAQARGKVDTLAASLPSGIDFFQYLVHHI